jgi:hypothetical protein
MRYLIRHMAYVSYSYELSRIEDLVGCKTSDMYPENLGTNISRDIEYSSRKVCMFFSNSAGEIRSSTLQQYTDAIFHNPSGSSHVNHPINQRYIG